MSGDENSIIKDVDIDDLDIRIFMLVKNTTNIQSSVSFLNRRGWETICQNNISKSIDTIVKSRPEIVMVSVNHPNPNVLRLPQLLSQSMNTITIGFAESPDPVSSAKLNKSRFQYKFSGFPSGPSFHRYIRQILDRTHNAHKYEDRQNKKRKSLVKKAYEDPTDPKNSNSSGHGTDPGSDGRSFSNSKDSGMINVKGGSAGFKSKGSNSDAAMIQSGPARVGPNSKSDESLSPEERARLEEEFLKEDGFTGRSSNSTEEANSNQGQAGENRGAGQNIKEGSGLNYPGSDVKAGEARGSLSDNSKPSFGSKVPANSFDEVDEQGFKKKRKPKRKLYPWQKSDDSPPDPIKDHESRPGASFEMKQSRKDLMNEDDEKEKKDFSEEGSGLGVQKGSQGEHAGPLSESGPKPSEIDLNQDGQKKDKGANDFDSDPRKSDTVEQTGADENGLKKKQESSDTDSSSKKQNDEASGDISTKNRPSETRDSADKSASPKPGESTRDEVPSKKLPESEDKFRRLLKEALKQATDEADPSVRIEIEDVEKIGVIPLNSATISGYVVVSRSGIGFDLGTDLLDTLIHSIETIMPAHGIDVHCQKPFIMETDKFNFDFWKKNVGLFTVFEQSQREEIALTFLQTEVSVPEMRVSEHDPDMVKIEVSNIDSSVPVNFNTYIYLERNQRFYKYINDGRKILDRQKDKLGKSKKTRELHIARSDFQSFQQYYAKNVIQNLLEVLSTDIETEKKKSA